MIRKPLKLAAIFAAAAMTAALPQSSYAALPPLSTGGASSTSISTPAPLIAANNNPHISLGTSVWRVYGHADFCSRVPDECLRNTGPTMIVTMTPQIFKRLQTVNTQFNRAVTYQRDSDQYGREEYWTYPDTGYGDCEDYALAKRRALMKDGWPPSALLLATAYTETNEGHAVLIARTNTGDYVLDNRYDAVMLWSALPYKWEKIQSPRHSGQWLRINTASAAYIS